MKRYLLFAGDSYIPAGGWHDYKGSYETIEEAKKAAGTLGKDAVTHEPALPYWSHVVDMDNEVIAESWN